MALFEIKDVSHAFFANQKKHEAKVALDHLNLAIEEGEFVSLLGPSGCGKTVTLSILAGFLRPACGIVTYRGKSIEGPGPERGVVFQEYSLFPWLSVEQNVLFSARHAAQAQGNPLSRSELHSRVAAALETVGLADAADVRPNTLSGGMKQRVAIARLLAMDSDVLLMDEPFSALDEQTRRSLDESLVSLWQGRGKTVVFVTHNVSEAILVSSRIVLFSASPGHVVGEWKLPAGFDRNPLSPQSVALAQEIVSCMPFSPAKFCIGQEEG